MINQFSATNILQFWYILEQLNPFNVHQVLKQQKRHSHIDRDENLPWLNSEILSKKYKLSTYEKNQAGEKVKIDYNYHIYLGIFSTDSVFNFLDSLPKPKIDTFEELAISSNYDSCYASFFINSEGYLVDDSLSYSATPWILNRIQQILTKNKQINLSQWTEDWEKYLKSIKLKFSSQAKAFGEANHKITITDLKNLLGLLLDEQWIPEKFTALGYYIIPSKSESEEPSPEIFNSFYLKDLGNVIKAFQTGQVSQPLKQYLVDSSPKRINVEKLGILQHCLSPKYLPLGRWPSNPNYNLSLMQQMAINLTANIQENGGIF